MWSESVKVLEGGFYQDQRGTISFANTFDLSWFRRCYHINHSNTFTVRAWQGHRFEEKAFWVIAGSFLLQWVSLDNVLEPDKQSQVNSAIIKASCPQVILVPAYFANGFQALEPGSSLMVFSNKTVEESEQDDFRWPVDFFVKAEWRDQ